MFVIYETALGIAGPGRPIEAQFPQDRARAIDTARACWEHIAAGGAIGQLPDYEVWEEPSDNAADRLIYRASDGYCVSQGGEVITQLTMESYRCFRLANQVALAGDDAAYAWHYAAGVAAQSQAQALLWQRLSATAEAEIAQKKGE